MKMTMISTSQFEPRFAAGDDIFVERYPLMASAADRLAYEKYFSSYPAAKNHTGLSVSEESAPQSTKVASGTLY